MPKLKTIVVIHTTHPKEPAESTSNFTLEIIKSGPDVPPMPFQNIPNQRKLGKTDVYQFDVSGKDVNSDDEDFSIRMKIDDVDRGWLPQSMFVLGVTSAGRGILLGYHPQWDPDGWFGGTFATGRQRHVISR